MGLDIQCKCDKISFRAGAYSGFGEFREKLAKIIGVNLDNMVGFGGQVIWTKNEPFYELLNHSDCDGELTPIDCKELTQDFETYKKQILETWKDEAEFWWLEAKIKDWEEAVNHCATENCTLEFC
jgi:hypothetical protein